MDSKRMSCFPSCRPQAMWIAPTGVALACALLMGGSALAQTTPATSEAGAQGQEAPNALPTVTVTARKRAEVMLDVPISIQALSERELRASGISDVKDLGEQTGFSFSSAQGTGAQGRSFGVVTFRGLQGELNFPWENSGGIFVDGIFISGGVSGLGLGDVARVEVLKGPQNAFFGRSTFGGAVNFVTKNPGTTLAGTVNATVSNDGSNDVDASISGPLLGDTLSGRVSFGSKTKAALFHATDGGDLGAEGSRYVSGMLYFKPSDSVWVRLRGLYQQDEDSAPATGMISANSNTSCTGKTYTGQSASGATVTYTPSVAYFCDGIPSYKEVGSKVFDANTALPASVYAAFVDNSLQDPFLAKAPRLTHMGMKRETLRLSAQAAVLLPHDMDLAVNVGYNESNSTSIHDLDRSKVNAFLALQTNLTRDLTMDARLSTSPSNPLRGLLGASYFVSTFQLSQIDLSSAFGQVSPTRSTGAYLDLRAHVPAVYGAVEYDINDKWTVSAEARYQKDKSAYVSLDGHETSNTINSSLPRVTLRYKPMATLSAYVNLARGVQPLTVNGGYANANAAGKAYLENLFPGITAFTPQPKLESAELGVKQQVSRSFQYAAAVYDQKWSNRLSGTTVFNPASCGTTVNTPECPFATSGTGVTISNEARVRGLELTVDGQITPSWSAGGYLDYKDATWTKFDAANAAVLTAPAVAFHGNHLARLPKFTVSANTTYRFGLSDGWSGYTRGDFTLVGKRWETDFNFTQDDGYKRFDWRLGFEKKDLLVELFVRNVFNAQDWGTVSRYFDLTAQPLTNFNRQAVQVTLQDPRSIGARLRYSF